MNNNYAKQPVDAGANVLFGYPSAKRALAQYENDNASLSSVITATDNTSVVEITAGAVPAIFRWVAQGDTIASVTTANFDHAIGANQTRRFAFPIESQGVNSIVGINKQSGYFNRYAYKSNGVGSVFATEF